MSDMKCSTCGSTYAEYINGCPRCWEVGIRAGVIAAKTPFHDWWNSCPRNETERQTCFLAWNYGLLRIRDFICDPANQIEDVIFAEINRLMCPDFLARTRPEEKPDESNN